MLGGQTARAFEAGIEALRKRYDPSDLARVEDCLEIFLGSKEAPVAAPDHDPYLVCFPGLSASPWHETNDLPWISRMESHYGEVKAELLKLVEEEAGFHPYEDPYTKELGWRGWDNFTLYRRGRLHKRNSERCPRTTQALTESPFGPRQQMFTRLKPGVRITPHSGGVNILLTCHLALLVPDGCGIRVGSASRTWEEGRCLLFDDSFMHEAWNDGTADRYVLIWDVWHPDLTEVETHALKALFPAFEKAVVELRGR